MKKVNKEIKIIQVMMSNDRPAFVELYSTVEHRNIIMKAERFCSTFGWSMDELEGFNRHRTNKQDKGN